MSNHQYKAAQNFTTVTHANTMLGQLDIRNTASALCLYIPFHKKENCHSLLKLTDSYGGNTVYPCITVNTHTHTPLAYLYSHTHMLYTSTRRHTYHLQDLQLIPCLHLNFYIFSLCHPEKHWLFSKNNLLSSLPFPFFIPLTPSSFYLHEFKVVFLRSQTIHPTPQLPLSPTLKQKIVINTLFLTIYLSKAESAPLLFSIIAILKIPLPS